MTLAVLLILAMGLAGAARAGDTEVFRLRDPGETLPEMTLYDLEGRAHTLPTDLQGAPIVLFFWSVYCPNCKEAMPGLMDLHASARDRDVVIWAVNVDGDRFSNAVRAFVQDVELPLPVLYDRLEGEYLVAADPLGVSKTPTLYLAGGNGKIALRQVIEMDFEAVGRSLAEMEQ
jgi:peroxiredoxin